MPKTTGVYLRLSERNYVRLKTLAKVTKMTMTEYLTERILEDSYRFRIDVETNRRGRRRH